MSCAPVCWVVGAAVDVVAVAVGISPVGVLEAPATGTSLLLTAVVVGVVATGLFTLV